MDFLANPIMIITPKAEETAYKCAGGRLGK